MNISMWWLMRGDADGIVNLTGLGRVLAESRKQAAGLHHAEALWAHVSSCQTLKAVARAER